MTRTVANIRFCFSRNGGTLGNSGSLQFLFERKAVFEVLSDGLDEEEFTLEMIEAGAEDIEEGDDRFTVYAEKDVFGAIQAALERLGITPEEASLERPGCQSMPGDPPRDPQPGGEMTCCGEASPSKGT